MFISVHQEFSVWSPQENSEVNVNCSLEIQRQYTRTWWTTTWNLSYAIKQNSKRRVWVWTSFFFNRYMLTCLRLSATTYMPWRRDCLTLCNMSPCRHYIQITKTKETDFRERWCCDAARRRQNHSGLREPRGQEVERLQTSSSLATLHGHMLYFIK